jgi:Flp pilus assembly protein TadD
MKRRPEKFEIVEYPSFAAGAFAQHFRRERSAMAHYRKEIKRTGYWKAHFNLAWLMSRRRRLREAVEHYRLAIRHRPPRLDAAAAWMNLGLAYHQLDRPKEAARALRRALQLDRGNAQTVLNMAMVSFENGDPDEGKECLQRWFRRSERSAEGDDLAAYLLIEYDVDIRKGIRLLGRLLCERPDDAVVRADLARAYVKLGDRRAASRFAREARRLAAKNPEHRRIVLRALRKAGFR